MIDRQQEAAGRPIHDFHCVWRTRIHKPAINDTLRKLRPSMPGSIKTDLGRAVPVPFAVSAARGKVAPMAEARKLKVQRGHAKIDAMSISRERPIGR